MRFSASLNAGNTSESAGAASVVRPGPGSARPFAIMDSDPTESYSDGADGSRHPSRPSAVQATNGHAHEFDPLLPSQVIAVLKVEVAVLVGEPEQRVPIIRVEISEDSEEGGRVLKRIRMAIRPFPRRD